MIKNELQNIISAIGITEQGNLIQSIACFLRTSKKTSSFFEKEKFTQQEEAVQLIHRVTEQNLWFNDLNKDNFFAEGAEQKVYLSNDGNTVFKINDSIFYEFWVDYFNNLLLHNFFFPSTPYTLLGFILNNNQLFAVVKQPFIQITEETDLSTVATFLLENDFKLKKNNDYYNEELGVILEDLHDENVLTNNGVLFFVDTVFYLTDKFYT